MKAVAPGGYSGSLTGYIDLSVFSAPLGLKSVAVSYAIVDCCGRQCPKGRRSFHQNRHTCLLLGQEQHVMQGWEERKTEETRSIEDVFRTDFPRTDAYRFNSASIRLRVIDDRFEGKSIAEQEAMVLPLLKKVPKKTRDDVLLLLTLAPSEQSSSSNQTLMNMEFGQPLPSRF